MTPRSPIAELHTHDVTNMPPHIGDQDLWASDTVLKECVEREGGGWSGDHLAKLGRAVGAAEMFDKADAANRHPPELKAFDRYGMRVNQVEFHPAYHELMDLAISHQVPNFAWNTERAGSQVGHMALTYMFSQVEGGVMCPMAMTYAVVPVLRANSGACDEWLPRVLSTSYDRRDIPANEKNGATIGMFMTEKQGGSDVRANSTTAVAITGARGEGAEYHLTGHKFFCSAPMCDAFLTLAYADGGLSCFLIPRWKPDGSRNNLALQRLKDKLGNRSNASSEMEFQDTWGVMIGEEGRGIRTIIDMVQGNRLYCAMSSAGMMRQGVVQALHHTAHRSAFQKRLIQQPLMRNVLADLALESEAAVALCMRVARAVDSSATDESEAALARIGTAVIKYSICKRAPAHLFECLECHGGPGYIEESIMPRLYREAPVNSIWEGSGNVVCLDVLRAMQREPESIAAIVSELRTARGASAELDTEVDKLSDELSAAEDLEIRARALTERIAVALQAALLVRHAPSAVADAFCASRLGEHRAGCYGALPASCQLGDIIDRAMPAV